MRKTISCLLILSPSLRLGRWFGVVMEVKVPPQMVTNLISSSLVGRSLKLTSLRIFMNFMPMVSCLKD